MCLAIPGKVVSISDTVEGIFKTGKVSFEGVIKEINLSMVPEAVVGDYVLVHVGVAIGTIDEEEANKTFEYLKIIGETEELNAGESQ